MTTVPRITVHTSEGQQPRTTPESDLLTPAEVAAMFRVAPKTVTRWAKAGKLRAVHTLGGHRRYYRADVEALLHGETPERAS